MAGFAIFLALRSRGDIAYALTVVWALIGISIANAVSYHNTLVAIFSGILSFVMVGVLFLARSGRLSLGRARAVL